MLTSPQRQQSVEDTILDRDKVSHDRHLRTVNGDTVVASAGPRVAHNGGD